LFKPKIGTMIVFYDLKNIPSKQKFVPWTTN